VLRFTPDSLGQHSARSGSECEAPPLRLANRMSRGTGRGPHSSTFRQAAATSRATARRTSCGATKRKRHLAVGDERDVRTAETYVRTIGDTSWEIRAIADFTGDQAADLLWRNTVTGELYSGRWKAQFRSAKSTSGP